MPSPDDQRDYGGAVLNPADLLRSVPAPLSPADEHRHAAIRDPYNAAYHEACAEAEEMRAERDHARGERDAAVGALRELVRLKDKDHPGPLNPKSAQALDYKANKPKAWDEARRVLREYDEDGLA